MVGLISCTHYIYCLKADGSLKSKHHGNGTISQVAIGDINNDGKPELVAYNAENPIHTALMRKTVAYDSSFNVLWTATCKDYTDASASFPILCDLMGNGYKNVLVEDCINWPPKGGSLKILSGLDGKAPDNSGGALYENDSFATQTLNERPVAVADIDESGHLSVVGEAHDSAGYVYGVCAITCNSWADGRNLFTSERYHITDINDNLTVPRVEPPNWQSHNTWDAQSISGGSGWGTPYQEWKYVNSSFGENIFFHSYSSCPRRRSRGKRHS